MKFKVCQKVLITTDTHKKPIKGDYFIIVGYPKGNTDYVMIGNVENGHGGNHEDFCDENGQDIEDPRNGSEQYWYIHTMFLIDPNDIQKIKENKEKLPKSIIEKLGLK